MPVLAAVVMTLFAQLFNGPDVLLSPTGITIRRTVTRTHIRWEDLPYSEVQLMNVKGAKHLRLGPKTVDTRDLNADPVLLLGVIEHYIQHPENHAVIGTIAELDRVRSVIGSV